MNTAFSLAMGLPRRIFALVVAIWRVLLEIGDAQMGLWRLFSMWRRSRKGDPIDPLSADVMRPAFAVARVFAPVVEIPRVFVKAYTNDATALVTRYDDVVDILSRDAEFESVYGPRMRELTDGPDFILALPNNAQYARDMANSGAAMRRTDVAERIAPLVARESESVTAGFPDGLDVPADLTTRVPARLAKAYFGLTADVSEDFLIRIATDCFWYIFFDLGADPEVRARATSASSEFRAFLDREIAAAHERPPNDETVLDRFIALQRAGVPGNDDAMIRTNLLGFISATIPTMSRLAVLALDELMRRPDMLAGVQAAARAGDDGRYAQGVFEASRFNTFTPMVYRRATRDAVVGRSTLRARTIKKGALVFCATQSAMFDRREIAAPTQFRFDRPWRHYMLWGEGFHVCIGEHINRAVVPAMLKPLMKKRNLRRAEGEAGQIDDAGSPFPRHWRVLYDPD